MTTCAAKNDQFVTLPLQIYVLKCNLHMPHSISVY